jgi:hypothetical protein
MAHNGLAGDATIFFEMTSSVGCEGCRRAPPPPPRLSGKGLEAGCAWLGVRLPASRAGSMISGKEINFSITGCMNQSIAL